MPTPSEIIAAYEHLRRQQGIAQDNLATLRQRIRPFLQAGAQHIISEQIRGFAGANADALLAVDTQLQSVMAAPVVGTDAQPVTEVQGDNRTNVLDNFNRQHEGILPSNRSGLRVLNRRQTLPNGIITNIYQIVDGTNNVLGVTGQVTVGDTNVRITRLSRNPTVILESHTDNSIDRREIVVNADYQHIRTYNSSQAQLPGGGIAFAPRAEGERFSEEQILGGPGGNPGANDPKIREYRTGQDTLAHFNGRIEAERAAFDAARDELASSTETLIRENEAQYRTFVTHLETQVGTLNGNPSYITARSDVLERGLISMLAVPGLSATGVGSPSSTTFRPSRTQQGRLILDIAGMSAEQATSLRNVINSRYGEGTALAVEGTGEDSQNSSGPRNPHLISIPISVAQQRMTADIRQHLEQPAQAALVQFLKQQSGGEEAQRLGRIFGAGETVTPARDGSLVLRVGNRDTAHRIISRLIPIRERIGGSRQTLPFSVSDESNITINFASYPGGAVALLTALEAPEIQRDLRAAVAEGRRISALSPEALAQRLGPAFTAFMAGDSTQRQTLNTGTPDAAQIFTQFRDWLGRQRDAARTQVVIEALDAIEPGGGLLASTPGVLDAARNYVNTQFPVLRTNTPPTPPQPPAQDSLPGYLPALRNIFGPAVSYEPTAGSGGTPRVMIMRMTGNQSAATNLAATLNGALHADNPLGLVGGPAFSAEGNVIYLYPGNGTQQIQTLTARLNSNAGRSAFREALQAAGIAPPANPNPNPNPNPTPTPSADRGFMSQMSNWLAPAIAFVAGLFGISSVSGGIGIGSILGAAALAGGAAIASQAITGSGLFAPPAHSTAGGRAAPGSAMNNNPDTPMYGQAPAQNPNAPEFQAALTQYQSGQAVIDQSALNATLPFNRQPSRLLS